MRISTSAMHQNALSAMMSQQTALAKTQNQVSTGKRVLTPSDDPVAAVHIMELQRALQQSQQYTVNAGAAGDRLSLEENALADMTNVMQRVREKALEANNGTLDADSRKMIATELRQRLDELVNIANRRDSNGEYLFSGYSTSTQPFAQANGSISYAGDQGSRALQIGPTQTIADSDSGFDLFMNIQEGNGTFVLGGSTGNTGTGVLGAGTVIDASAWTPDDYTMTFTSATGDYQIVDSSANVVATGTYTAGSSIQFNGIQFDMTGTPAQNDTFTISRSRKEDVFTTVQGIIDSLEGTSATTDSQFSSNMSAALQQLDQVDSHVLQVRAKVGTRLSELDSVKDSLDQQQLDIKQSKSDLEDLDYTEAVTRMNQQLIGLQAAQSAYAKISQLSLFDYLR
jgi:flagellar hook-associated protein 3 FlgL